jgi:hypothetical protein
MTTILLATIVLLLVLILVVLLNHLPEEKRSTLTWRARIIALWVAFGGSVVLFGLGMLLAWVALTNDSSEMGWIGAGLMVAGLAGGWWPAWRLDHALNRVLRVAEFLIAGGLAVELFLGRLRAQDVALSPVYAGLLIVAFWAVTRTFWTVVSLLFLAREEFDYKFPHNGVTVSANRTRTPGLVVVPFPGREHRYYIVHEASGTPVSPQGEPMTRSGAFLCARMLKHVCSDWSLSAKEIGIYRRFSIETKLPKNREYERFRYTLPTGEIVTAYRTRTPGLILTPARASGRKYHITHEQSGSPIAGQEKPLRKWLAFRIARLTSGFPIDWTLPAEELDGFLEKAALAPQVGLPPLESVQ